ncbi:hypothetical protein [Sphingopyxis sp. PET50]|uniref:hypothetical protein n=1 Tax=Sphingopyxis sp. PET50 TaxID=2976533 RepID=UPI0021B042AC|nr:hypothetical protein [Sphingopyxis sp. PET50]
MYLDIASGGSTTFSISQTQSLVFNPATTTTTNVTNYSTQIIGRLLGGAPLYDQTFAVAFADPAAQAGVVAARAAITTAARAGRHHWRAGADRLVHQHLIIEHHDLLARRHPDDRHDSHHLRRGNDRHRPAFHLQRWRVAGDHTSDLSGFARHT